MVVYTPVGMLLTESQADVIFTWRRFEMKHEIAGWQKQKPKHTFPAQHHFEQILS